MNCLVRNGMLAVVRRSDCLVPVEVKAKNRAAKSPRILIESGAYPDIDRGIKPCGGNAGREGPVLLLPYFTAFILRGHLAGKWGNTSSAGTPCSRRKKWTRAPGRP